MDENGFLKVALICWKSYSERCSKVTNITKFCALFGIGPKAALDVYDSREEYQIFPRKVFRKHLNQELTKNLEKAYSLNRKVNK
jgi:hypothetical protein